MKRLVCAIFILLLLTGCAGLTQDSYVSVQPHKERFVQKSNDDAVEAEDYAGLRAAILGFVEKGQTEGVIRVTSYDGDVETDVAQAAYEVSKQEPIGAYAVDYMTHECVRVVSYYEIRIHTTFRRTREEMEQVEFAASTIQLENRVHQALEDCETGIVLRMDSYWEQDVAAMVDEYCMKNPASVIEKPQITVATYPDSGAARILEIGFDCVLTPEERLSRKAATRESLDGAAEYIRYRQTERDKITLLYTYLTGRFSYEPGQTETPLYAALCEGVADPVGLTQAWQLICDKAGVKCHTVYGAKHGEPYCWNVVSADGVYRHLDLMESILNRGQLALLTDSEMTEYSWEPGNFPECR